MIRFSTTRFFDIIKQLSQRWPQSTHLLGRWAASKSASVNTSEAFSVASDDASALSEPEEGEAAEAADEATALAGEATGDNDEAEEEEETATDSVALSTPVLRRTTPPN